MGRDPVCALLAEIEMHHSWAEKYVLLLVRPIYIHRSIRGLKRVELSALFDPDRHPSLSLFCL